jgi:quinol monooxygenase YgiN
VYVVTVAFRIRPQHVDAFLAAVVENARASTASEPACRQFDVCVAPDDPGSVFLYEVYDDRAAFAAHLGAKHFLDFDRRVAPWIESKTVRVLQRIAPD